MRKIIKPCGFHCIKINNLGVTLQNQVILENINLGTKWTLLNRQIS